MEPHPILGYIEYVCIVWFILEYGELCFEPSSLQLRCIPKDLIFPGTKMLVSSDRRKTFFQLLNIIDLMAILPFIIEMMLFMMGISTDQLRDLKVRSCSLVVENFDGLLKPCRERFWSFGSYECCG